MIEALHEVIGRDGSVTWWQMMVRATVVFIYSVLLVRFGRQAFGKRTSLDIVVGVILGSILSRTITGNSPLIPTCLAAGTIVALRALLAAIAVRHHGFGHALKGEEIQLVKNGNTIDHAMRHAGITPRDLMEAVRLQSSKTKLEEIDAAYLERNGEISVIRR